MLPKNPINNRAKSISLNTDMTLQFKMMEYWRFSKGFL